MSSKNLYFVILILLSFLDLKASANILQPLIEAIENEYFKVDTCDIVPFQKKGHVFDMFDVLYPNDLITFNFYYGSVKFPHAPQIEKNAKCLISIVDWKASSEQEIEQILQATRKVRKNAMLVLNCDYECMTKTPANIDKPTFFMPTNEAQEEATLLLSCPSKRSPQIFAVIKPDSEVRLYQTKCPFIFHGKLVNVTYSVAPPGTNSYYDLDLHFCIQDL